SPSASPTAHRNASTGEWRQATHPDWVSHRAWKFSANRCWKFPEVSMKRALAILLLTVPSICAAEPPLPTSHTVRNIEGWTVHIDDRLLAGPDAALGERAIRILTNRLYEITMAVPGDKVERMRKVTVWLDLTHGKMRPMQYHPSAGWLKNN